jgi:hypothetical protein
VFDVDQPIAQTKDTITIEYSRGLTRTVQMNAKHPASIKPSRAGHSVGRWMATHSWSTQRLRAGSLRTVPNSDKLHVVERFTSILRRSRSSATMSPTTQSISPTSTKARTSWCRPTRRTQRIVVRT